MQGGDVSASSSHPDDYGEEMKVLVKTTKTIPLRVSSTDTINDVKTKLFSIEGVSPNMQELVFGGNILNGVNKLADCHIQNNSTIKMFHRTGINMKIHIKAPSIGMMITVDVNHLDTIQTVKAKIQKEQGIGTSHMALIYIGKELENSETLASYNIHAGSILYAVFHGGSKIRICVSTPTIRRIELEVKPWYDVESVKTMIESIVWIPTKEQRLIFSGRPMENDQTLLHFSVQNGSEIVMVLVVRFFVQTSSGKRIEMEMERSDTVGDVKRKIQEKESIQPDRQVLILNGLQLNERETLSYYNIQNGSKLELVIHHSDKMQIFVRTWRGKTIVVNVKRFDSVDSLKERIEAREGIPKECQKIIFAGKLLVCGHTLADYDIQKESNLQLDLSLTHHCYEIPICVLTRSGNRIEIQMRISDTIGSLKEKIEDKEGISPVRQVLIYAGKKLEAHCTLGYYNILREATISLVVT